MSHPPRIDSHMHVWQLSRGDYGWLTPDLSAIYRDFTIEDARACWTQAGIDYAILVQAAPTLEETRYLLSVAESEPQVKGVVGWIDMLALDAVSHLERLASNKLLRGIRPMLQDIPDDGWMLKAELTPVYRALVELRLCFDALVLPRHLANLSRLIDRHPDLKIVVDHGAKPPIGERLDLWHKDLARLASIPHVHCKFSGLVTECRGKTSAEALEPVAQALLALFGPERLMFGSDWPVCTLRSSYVQWWQWAQELTAHLPANQRNALFGGTAHRFYGLS
ncbi:amidohydrolase family protein [Microvirga arsenatis]|uniref:Amidohydrolase family protein n=1 Tax=Microvirga arsenatis TaxID=2692265 RepID=A0ABW9Z3L6_9HYPH|nr:amidohydrolase family protein [Microvirga arsenatis]NBJ13826.1 amidohydrolase family protein [Microvirga arsenatis]NBJ27282.1 amidohydrolase family protein [Microvirga arsenatis]